MLPAGKMDCGTTYYLLYTLAMRRLLAQTRHYYYVTGTGSILLSDQHQQSLILGKRPIGTPYSAEALLASKASNVSTIKLLHAAEAIWGKLMFRYTKSLLKLPAIDSNKPERRSSN